MPHNSRLHVGIDYALNTASPRMLYGFEFLEPQPDQCLLGCVKLDQQQFQSLQALIGEDSIVFIGRSRSRGYGRVCLSLQDYPRKCQAIKPWSDSFKQALKARGCQISESKTYFSIYAHSPIIAFDKILRPCADDAEVLGGL